jgi:hypothetical protein
MRKLELEALHVESFETMPGAPRSRGTVQAHADAPGTGTGTGPIPMGTGPSDCMRCDWTLRCQPATYSPRDCGETRYFDCTYQCTVACSDMDSCDICVLPATYACVREPA